MDSDAQLLMRVSNVRDFFGSAWRDSLDDWDLAKDFGEFLVRTLPESEVMGHALLVRANRHVGNLALALAELELCKARIVNRKLEPWEIEMLVPLLAQEEKLLSE